MAEAVYETLEDSTVAGRIPPCPGVLAFANSPVECARDLRSTLEDWVLVGIKMMHPLRVVGGISLNQEPVLEPVDAL